jgi:Bacterial EndoU nuclease
MKMPTLFVLFALLFAAFPAAAKQNDLWSKTNPAISLAHIFDGQINRKGKPTGFHHRYLGQNSKTARVKKILSPINKFGIYTAIVEIFSRKDKIWKEKFSSLFPDRLTRSQMVQEIAKVYRNRQFTKGQKWRGKSSYGFEIEGYTLKDGRIITAYPIYRKD